jgi:Big-like domain-containing protein
MTRLVVLLAALLAAAAAVQGSQATFTASKTNSSSSFVTAAKFPPTVTLTAPANGSFTNDTTPLITGTADNATGDSTTVTAKIYSGTSATGSPVQTKTGTRSGTTYSFSLTTALAQGTYTAVVTQTDTSGNTGTSNANTFTVDTTAPTATNITATNKAGGTAGKVESGDTLTYTYSEAVTPASVWLGWDGSSTAVHIKFTSAGNDTITVLTTADVASLKLGSVATNGDYVTATTTFNATIAMSPDGASVIVTLGTPSNVSASPNVGRNMSWTPTASVKDLAGNAASTTAYSETDSDVDF